VVNNFLDGKVFFIDISRGFNEKPVILGFERTLALALDMALTPDNKYLLVTDGIFYPSNIAIIDMATRQLVYIHHLAGQFEAQFLAISQDVNNNPDVYNVLVLDINDNHRIRHLIMEKYKDKNNQEKVRLTHKKSISLLPFFLGNVSISPDGKTVIIPFYRYSACAALYFDDLGELHLSKIVALPAKNGQSCVFNKDGTKVYYLSSSQEKGTMVVVLDVNPNIPGEVSPSGTTISIPWRGTDSFFCHNAIALDPSENYLYVSNTSFFGALMGIAVIDLATNTKVDSVKGTGIPTGIAFATIDDED
jgi:DNA-binding beta-propeller fold protein YncE